jgi:hypothetical protein
MQAMIREKTTMQLTRRNLLTSAAATRHKFYDMASTEKALVAGFHFSFPSLGYVEKDGPRYRLVPVAWQPVI